MRPPARYAPIPRRCCVSHLGHKFLRVFSKLRSGADAPGGRSAAVNHAESLSAPNWILQIARRGAVPCGAVIMCPLHSQSRTTRAIRPPQFPQPWGRLTPALFFCSSPITGESGSDFEADVFVVSESVGHALDDLDLVVDALEQARVERPAAIGEDAGEIGLETIGESDQGRLDPRRLVLSTRPGPRPTRPARGAGRRGENNPSPIRRPIHPTSFPSNSSSPSSRPG